MKNIEDKKNIVLLVFAIVTIFALPNDALTKKVVLPAPQQPIKHVMTIWVGGDSLSTEIGRSVWEQFRKTDKVVVKGFHKGSCGLARFDYFNWPKHIEQQMKLYNPDVVIFMIGANDAQNIVTSNKRGYLLGTEKWQKEYSQRVGQLMDLLGSKNRLVIWLGIPIMRDINFNKKMMVLNKTYSAEALKRPFVKYVPTERYLADSRLQYTDYLHDSKGTRQQVRISDGIHLYPAGANRITPIVLKTIETYYPALAANITILR